MIRLVEKKIRHTELRLFDLLEQSLSFSDKLVQRNHLVSYRIPRLKHLRAQKEKDGTIVHDQSVLLSIKIDFLTTIIQR